MSSFHSEMKNSFRHKRIDRDESMEIDDYYRGSAVVDWSGNKITQGLEEKHLEVDDIAQSREKNIESADIDSFQAPPSMKVTPLGLQKHSNKGKLDFETNSISYILG